MRIFYIITRSIPGGAQSHLLELIHGYRRTNTIGLLTGENGFLCDEANRLGADVFVVPDLVRSILPHRDIRAVWKIARILRFFSPDIVHAHCFKAGLVGRAAAGMTGVPSLYTAHGWQFAPGTPVTQRLVAFAGEWLGALFGQQIITVSDYDMKLALRCGITSQGSISVVHNGIQDIPVRRYLSDSAEINAVMVARFVPQKDQRSVLRALIGLDPRIRVWFVGDGPTLPEIIAESHDLKLEGRVSFLGHRADVAQILGMADIFLLASHYEGLPISILEALRAGLPVITTDAGGARECVHDGVTGLVVPRGDVNALRNAIGALAGAPSLRARMGTAGRRLFERQFTSGRMLSRTYSVYERLLYGGVRTTESLRPKKTVSSMITTSH